MYTEKLKSYVIDLDDDESERWRKVIHQERSAMRALAEEAIEDMKEMSSLTMSPVLHYLFSLFYRTSGGRYFRELKSIADAMGVSASLATVMNCTYELSHYGEWVSPFGCTAGAHWVDGLGMVHARNMDWPLENIGKATRLFRFVEGSREFLSVGIAGFVGVLSGMVPGSYSVTINWAPPTEAPRFDWGPSFLLREVLATCDTYEEAVEELSTSSLATSVFFLVCGTQKGQACVIERTQDLYALREMGRGPLVQANHHVLRDFLDNNASLHEEDVDGCNVYEDSHDRRMCLQRELKKVKRAQSLDEIGKCLDVEPVHNEFSYQQMVFHPESGEVKVWRWS